MLSRPCHNRARIFAAPAELAREQITAMRDVMSTEEVAIIFSDFMRDMTSVSTGARTISRGEMARLLGIVDVDKKLKKIAYRAMQAKKTMPISSICRSAKFEPLAPTYKFKCR